MPENETQLKYFTLNSCVFLSLSSWISFVLFGLLLLSLSLSLWMCLVMKKRRFYEMTRVFQMFMCCFRSDQRPNRPNKSKRKIYSKM